MLDPNVDATTATTTNEIRHLQPYLDTFNDGTKTTSIATIRAVVMKLFSDTNIFNGYDEIKQCILMNDNKTGVDEKIMATLDLFSYSTYPDYMTNIEKYLPLNESQMNKLKQLTILQIIQDTCRVQKKNIVPYEVLTKALYSNNDVSTTIIRDIEQMIAHCIACNVFYGTLSQKNRSFTIQRIMMSRDVPVQDIPTKLLFEIQVLQQKLLESNHTIALYQQQQQRSSSVMSSSSNWMDFYKLQQQSNSNQLNQQQQSQQQKRASNIDPIGSNPVEMMDVELVSTMPPTVTAVTETTESLLLSSSTTSTAADSRRQKRSRGVHHNSNDP